MKTSTIKILGGAGLVACMAFIPVFPQTGKPVDIKELALYEGKDRQQRLLENAKREGEVSLYSSLTVPDLEMLREDFEKRYGVKLKFWRASSEKVVQRALTEARGGRFDFDAIETNGPEMEALHREKVLQDARSPHFSELNPQAIRPHHEWIGTRLNLFVHIYNTNLVKKEELPKKYEDLLDPKWKGRLGIEAEDTDWFATVIKEMGEEKGLKLFRDIVAKNGLSVRKGHTLLAGLVGSGEVPLALTVYSHNADKLKAKGAPVEWFVMPPAVARANGIALGKKPPHPHAALLFYDYLLSDGQAILLKGQYVPTNKKYESAAGKAQFKFVDPVVILDEREKWEKLYADIITKQSR